MTLWHCTLEDSNNNNNSANNNVSALPASIQSITICLPRYNDTSSTSLLNPLLECALSVEPVQQRYVVLSSRRSNLVACLALNPEATSAGGTRGASFGRGQQPVYHITCLNLRAPVISVDVTTVLGQAHHSAEAGEHLESVVIRSQPLPLIQDKHRFNSTTCSSHSCLT